MAVIIMAPPTNLLQDENVRKKHFNHENNLALQGYDPVSYFYDGAKKGKSSISYTYKSLVYYFISEEFKIAFKNNPEKYEPQYGGWCAYAMGNDGTKVEIDPETYKLVDGKLYLFYNAYFNNTKKTWDKNEPVLKPQADKKWAEIIKK